MTPPFRRQLTAILLLVTVFFTAPALIGHELKSGAMKEVCACQMLQDDCPLDSNEQPEECPCDSLGDCCDHEEHCYDSMDQAHSSGLNIHPSPLKLFHPEPAKSFPKVYLAIFVPPES
jgi:hypothetical protein